MVGSYLVVGDDSSGCWVFGQVDDNGQWDGITGCVFAMAAGGWVCGG